ncbi:MAG: hypothetical protein IJL62_04455 [Clostridia bacterium]|nr:hypothetical protein [Clostridia bacterium]
MKKTIAMILCVLMIAASVACTGMKIESSESFEIHEETNETVGGTVAGGWANAENPAMTDGLRAIFEKALEGMLGVKYVPVACLGTQVVAGTNYCFLAQATVVYPDATPKYVLVYVYCDLSGDASVMNIADLPVVPNENGETMLIPDEPLTGGWAYAESYEVTDEMKDRLSKALETLVGASYEPVANLATQVVAGTNRCLLCKVTPVVPDAVPHYALVYVYETLEGGAELLHVIDIDVGALCTYGA